MPPLVRFFRNRYNYTAPKTVIFDIGANAGETSAIFLSLFTPVHCIRQYKLHLDLSPEEIERSIPRACARSVVHILAVEAQSANVEVLNRRAETELWRDVGWEVIHSAVTRSAAPGENITFWGFDKAGTQQGSIAGGNAGWDSRREVVNVTTVDLILEERGLLDSEVYLLKIDIEGFDPWALEGANLTLARHAVKWVLFEYNSQWRATHATLGGVAARMHALGYQCFLILPCAGLLPLYPPFWHEDFELRQWSNVVCGREEDADVTSLVAYMIEGDRPSFRDYLGYRDKLISDERVRVVREAQAAARAAAPRVRRRGSSAKFARLIPPPQ